MQKCRGRFKRGWSSCHSPGAWCCRYCAVALHAFGGAVEGENWDVVEVDGELEVGKLGCGCRDRSRSRNLRKGTGMRRKRWNREATKISMLDGQQENKQSWVRWTVLAMKRMTWNTDTQVKLGR